MTHRYMLNGREVTREEFFAGPSKIHEVFESGQTAVAQTSAGWPKTSDSLAVHPSQAKEAYEQSVKLGVPTEFRPDGRPVLTDPGHQRAFARALGFTDYNESLGTRGGM